MTSARIYRPFLRTLWLVTVDGFANVTECQSIYGYKIKTDSDFTRRTANYHDARARWRRCSYGPPRNRALSVMSACLRLDNRIVPLVRGGAGMPPHS